MNQRVDSRATGVGLGEPEEGRGPGLFLVSISQFCENWQGQASAILQEKECALMNLILPECRFREDEKQTDIQLMKATPRGRRAALGGQSTSVVAGTGRHFFGLNTGFDMVGRLEQAAPCRVGAGFLQ